MTASRREFLGWALGSGGLLLAGRSALAPPPGYELLDVIPFAGEGRNFIGAAAGEGLNGRRAFDTSTLTSKKLIVPNEKFFIRTRHPGGLDSAKPWRLSVEGLVEEPVTLPVEEIAALAAPFGAHLLECSGSTSGSYFGLMGAAEWHGVALSRIFARVRPKPRAAQVLVSGVDPKQGPDPGASWIFAREDLERAGAALATRMNGVPLPKDHGSPLRLVVPGWYGCTWTKWVDRIAFVDDGAAATPQMQEYASRTLQSGRPRLARDFQPAVIDQAAMPVRLEMWRSQGRIFYRVVGILWGGERLTRSMRIRFDPEASFQPVENYEHRTNATWTLWSHTWRPAKAGRYTIRMRFADREIRTRRLDLGYYNRRVVIPEV